MASMRKNGAVATPRNIAMIALAVSLVLAAGLVVAAEPVHGSVLMTVMPGHGVDTGDLIVLPLLLLAAWLIRASSPSVRAIILVAPDAPGRRCPSARRWPWSVACVSPM